MAEEIKVRISLDDDLTGQLKKTRLTTQKETKKMAGGFGGVTKAVKGLVGAYIGLQSIKLAVGFFASAAKTAGDLNEALSKQATVFRGLEKETAAMNKELQQGYSLSRLESAKFLSAIQDTLVPLGVAREKAANMSFEVVKLARDLGSFNNIPTQEVIEGIQGALVGNTENLRRFGIAVNQAMIEQKAMEMGLIRTKKELTPTTKAMAILQMTTEQSGDAMGDWARTSNSFNNQLVAMKSNWTDFMSGVGTFIVNSPLMNAGLATINSHLKILASRLGLTKEGKAFEDRIKTQQVIGAKVLAARAKMKELDDKAKKVGDKELFKRTKPYRDAKEALDNLEFQMKGINLLVGGAKKAVAAVKPGTVTPFKADGGGGKTEKKKTLEEQNDAVLESFLLEEDLRIKTIENEKAVDDARDQIHKNNMDRIEQENTARHAAQINLINDLGMASESIKEFSTVYKATAIAQTIFDTYSGAQAAFAGFAKAIPGPVGVGLGVAAAGAAVAAGIARVDMIRQQKFATGGIVEGNSFTGDRVTASVNSGEMVLNRQQQSNLLNMANGNGGGGATFNFGGETIVVHGNADDSAVAAIGRTREQQLNQFKEDISELMAAGQFPAMQG